MFAVPSRGDATDTRRPPAPASHRAARVGRPAARSERAHHRGRRRLGDLGRPVAAVVQRRPPRPWPRTRHPRRRTGPRGTAVAASGRRPRRARRPSHRACADGFPRLRPRARRAPATRARRAGRGAACHTLRRPLGDECDAGGASARCAHRGAVAATHRPRAVRRPAHLPPATRCAGRPPRPFVDQGDGRWLWLVGAARSARGR